MKKLRNKLQQLTDKICSEASTVAHYSCWREWDSITIIHRRGNYQVNYYVSPDNPNRLVIGNLSVAPRHRRCGVASKVISRAEQDARSLGMHSIMLGVDRDAPEWLSDWYSRIGYEFHSLDEDGDTLLIKQLN